MAKITLECDQFIEYVINTSKDVFEDNNQKYITKTRINKLSILIFEELAKEDIHVNGFVWGYYRHGFFSPNVNNYIDRKYMGEFNLGKINETGLEISGNVYSFIYKAINELKKYFVRNKVQFPKWVYTKKTPKEYRSFYTSHRLLVNWFKEIENDTKNGYQITLFNKNDREITRLITRYYRSLWYIEDRKTLELFRRFTDLLEDLALKHNNGYDPYKIRLYLKKLNTLYDNKNDSVLNIITPYLLTIKGESEAINKEKERYNAKINSFKEHLDVKLNELYIEFEEEGLLPTFEEMREEVDQSIDHAPQNTKSLDEILDTLFDTLTSE